MFANTNAASALHMVLFFVYMSEFPMIFKTKDRRTVAASSGSRTHTSGQTPLTDTSGQTRAPLTAFEYMAKIATKNAKITK